MIFGHLLLKQFIKLQWRQTCLTFKTFQFICKPGKSLSRNVRFDCVSQLNFAAIIKSIEPSKTIKIQFNLNNFEMRFSYFFAFFASCFVFRLFGCLSFVKSFNKLVGGFLNEK